tara:strand:- start:1285 stop:1608 length:324 start_codon:yes stop_codon:yes gene_type:complete
MAVDESWVYDDLNYRVDYRHPNIRVYGNRVFNPDSRLRNMGFRHYDRYTGNVYRTGFGKKKTKKRKSKKTKSKKAVRSHDGRPVNKLAQRVSKLRAGQFPRRKSKKR